MNISDGLMPRLRCPASGQPLLRIAGGWRTADGARNYPDRDGFISLVHPGELAGDDARMNRLYEWLAPFYDVSERWLGRLLTGVDMAEGRQRIVNLLPLLPGQSLLEISPGPGVFQPMLRRVLGASASITAIDLSLAMLRQCRRQHADLRVDLVHGNAQYLPFADDSFDALFHFGGVNLFNQPEQALREFVRVVRPGGLVAWGDERMDASFRHPLGRRVLPRLNPGFRRTPPRFPTGLTDVREHVVYQGLGYLATAVKSPGAARD